MKYVLYYNRKSGNGITYKHYLQQEGVYVMDAKFALKFDDKLNADKFIERAATQHWLIVEEYDTQLKTFKGQWFRNPYGEYLSADDSFNNIVTVKSIDIDSAVELFKEREGIDSEIPFLDRVNVWEI